MGMRHILITLVVLLFFATTTFAAPLDHGLPPGPTGTVTDDGKVPTFGCVEDSYEPDSQSSPQMLRPGRIDDLGVCNGNDDYWRIDAEAGMALDIRIEFPSAVADVDMILMRASDQETLDISEGVTDIEEIRYTATTDERLILHVYGYEGVSNMYDLILEVEDFSAGCRGDAFESNDEMADAEEIRAGRHEATICMGDEDWYAVDVAPGEGFDFGVAFERDMSALSLGLFAEQSGMAPLEVRRSSGTTGQVVLSESPGGGRYFVRVSAGDNGYNRYSFSLARYAPGQLESGVVAGKVEYEDQLRGRDVVIGGPVTRWLPVREVPVELIRASDHRVIATAYTDDVGQYRIPFTHREGGDLFVRIAPRLEGPGYEMRVVGAEETVTHTIQSPAINTLVRNGAGEVVSDFRFEASGDLGGAFNITDRVLDAFHFIGRHTPPRDLDLTVVWQRGHAHSCTSCYSDGTISLGGGFDDPDEYDDSVILHEFGHFFIDQMSHDDSPGGHHSGERTDPLIAYGEGIATVFALMVEGQPYYADTMQSGGLNQNFETAPYPEARGTTNGTVFGQVSEYLVVAVIWDLVDRGVEPHDHLEAGTSAVMEVLTEYMPTCQSNNQGVAGAELADFVSGFRTRFPQHNDALDQILARHEFPAGIQGMARPSGVK